MPLSAGPRRTMLPPSFSPHPVLYQLAVHPQPAMQVFLSKNERAATDARVEADDDGLHGVKFQR